MPYFSRHPLKPASTGSSNLRILLYIHRFLRLSCILFFYNYYICNHYNIMLQKLYNNLFKFATINAIFVVFFVIFIHFKYFSSIMFLILNLWFLYYHNLQSKVLSFIISFILVKSMGFSNS